MKKVIFALFLLFWGNIAYGQFFPEDLDILVEKIKKNPKTSEKDSINFQVMDTIIYMSLFVQER